MECPIAWNPKLFNCATYNCQFYRDGKCAHKEIMEEYEKKK